jgi:hypothetical protein
MPLAPPALHRHCHRLRRTRCASGRQLLAHQPELRHRRLRLAGAGRHPDSQLAHGGRILSSGQDALGLVYISVAQGEKAIGQRQGVGRGRHEAGPQACGLDDPTAKEAPTGVSMAFTTFQQRVDIEQRL